MTTGARKSLIYHSRHQNIQRFRDVHPDAEVEINPADAADLGIADGDRVRVVSRVGELVIRAAVKHAAELRQGVVEIYHGWEDWRVNFLTPDDINDPISGFPLLKAVPVRIEKIDAIKGQQSMSENLELHYPADSQFRRLTGMHATQRPGGGYCNHWNPLCQSLSSEITSSHSPNCGGNRPGCHPPSIVYFH